MIIAQVCLRLATIKALKCAVLSHSTMHRRSHDNARPHVARICTQFLEAENIPVLAWPTYSPDMSPIEHVWDALDRVYTACSSSCQYPATSHSHWRGVDQHPTTINNLINSMWRICVALHEANDGHTRYWLVFGQYSKTAHFRVVFYCKAHQYNNHSVCICHTCEVDG